jgi:hypothetical protein
MYKIAIIDTIHQDIGLNILFPEAHYYTIYDDLDNIDKSESLNKYNIIRRYDIESINDNNYDYFFIIISSYAIDKNTPYYFNKIDISMQKIYNILDNNNFKKVFLFDNYDYDYDPSLYAYHNKINIYFKRNYNKNKIYSEIVKPFSFIMFGKYSMIEIIDNKRELASNADNRIYFSGTLFYHNDDKMNWYRNRHNIYENIKNNIYNPGRSDFYTYLNYINTSKFSLDLNGVGDPNKRTFEILSQGSLRIAEYNDIKWCFDDEFSEETIFKNTEDFNIKIKELMNDETLYKKCLKKQNEIVEKYFNIKWMREYLENYILR